MRVLSSTLAVTAAGILAWPVPSLAEPWYYVSFAADAKQVDQQCVKLPAGTSPEGSLAKHAGHITVQSDKTNTDQSRVLVLSTRSGTTYAYTSTIKACQAFRTPILAEVARRDGLDTRQWYVAQLTRRDCIPMRDMFARIETPEALHQQMTKDGTSMSLERRGDGVRLISFDRSSVPPLHLVKGQRACEDYVKQAY